MPESSAMRMLKPLVAIVVFGGVLVSAQIPEPRPADAPNAVPVRERRLVQRLEQARQLLAPSDANVKPDFAQGVRLLQSILDDGRGDEENFGAEDVFLEPNEHANSSAVPPTPDNAPTKDKPAKENATPPRV
ncbi:MAG TPA: hypothetical protein VK137_11090, partial [Planctomycetaceae bacterium]|nr:hypothetical protein [Planctomycetaceae bacterium]